MKTNRLPATICDFSLDSTNKTLKFANMKILIKVTKEILKESQYCESTIEGRVGMNCAIGKAITKLFPLAWVNDNGIIIFPDSQKLYYALLHPKERIIDKISISLPWEATQFIHAFDELSPEERINMQPISFEIDVPNELIEKIGIGEVYKILSESKTLEHVN